MSTGGQMPRIPSQQGLNSCIYLQEEPQFCTPKAKWYFSRQEIEDCSPSRKDGIDLQKESQLQKQYCLFIQELGRNLRLPQVTIACALMLCHRFYMRQSHVKNDWQIIAIASLLLACKIEDTRCFLRDLVDAAYELLFRLDSPDSERMRKSEFFVKQKPLIISGERLLLVTIAFDVDIKLPYKPLVDALKKLENCEQLARVAWNFVNDWLSTTLVLQYTPHYIAAGSLFLAAKLQKVKLPKKKGNFWWQEFDVSPKQLEEVIQQMVRLLEPQEKEVLPGKDSRISPSTVLVGKRLASSPQSTPTSGSISILHSKTGAMTEPASVEGSVCVKEVLSYQIIDNGSCIIENGVDESQSRKMEFNSSSTSEVGTAHSFYHNIDVKRIRELLKRRRREGIGNGKSNESMNTGEDSEAWIESVLENGIEVQSCTLQNQKGRSENF